MDTTRLDRLHVKLFAAVAGTIAVLTLAAYLVFSWSFERGFVEYVRRADEARLDALAVTLAEGYGREGGWDRLAADRERWIELVRAGLGLPTASTPDAESAQATAPGRIPLTIDPRLLLFDADRKQLVGRTELASRAILRPIARNGSTIGYLGHVPRTGLLESIESLYLARQHLTFGVLAAAMLAASLLLGAGVSYWITARVRRLAATAQALTAGDYSQRLDAGGNDELAQLARDFNVLAQTLDSARRSRQQWIADISHELRTPLSILRGEIEALQDGVRPLDQAAIGSLAAEAARLARLVEDLHTLSLSDLGALTYHKEPVDLAEVIEDVIDPQRRALVERGLRIETDFAPDAIVLGDADRLGQLFANLLQNSSRYTDAPGTIAVRLRHDGGRILVDWEDSAPGVPHEELARLTERLYRVEGSRSRAGGGSGLGLAIARALVEGHGGAMSAHAAGLGGLAIRIVLPGARG
jgi:two-component system, OmpR family, sensor histidine kinase BaeS